MPEWFQTIGDLDSGQAIIRARSYCVIEVAAGRLARIVFRPWPKIFTSDDVLVRSQFTSRRLLRDACRLYLNQPVATRNYLALKYIVSNFGTTFSTIRIAMAVADEIARLKRSDAILCHVAARNISDRLMARWGWARHLENSPRRQFVKRFYGDYPRHLSPEEIRAVGWRDPNAYLASFPAPLPHPPQETIRKPIERGAAKVEIE